MTVQSVSADNQHALLANTPHYQINFERFNEHLADICFDFVATTHAPTLSMVTWLAGSYLIREFSKNITAVDYQLDGTTHRSEKLNKNTFKLSHVKTGDRVRVRYEVYCRDLSVRTAFVDQTRLFGNFSSLLILLDDAKHTPATLTLSVPMQFLAQHPNCQIACGLQHETVQSKTGIEYRFAALAAFDYLDYPFEIGTQDTFEFVVNHQQKTLPHRFFLTGRHHGQLTRLQSDLQKICQTYLDWLDDAPFGHYTFMAMVTNKDYGGLEHINSTALISPRSDMPRIDEPMPPSDGYQRFLGLCSHEYFHAWWVKTVKPDVMINNPLTHESYTPLLWVFEGFTSYVDDLMLLVAGVIDKASYFKLISDQINRYQQTDGKAYQSVAESSFDAWIKFYRPDENSANQGISYYNKGALVALLLDLMLLDKSSGNYRLLDVIKHCYQQSNNQPFGLTTEILGDIIAPVLGRQAWQEFYENYVIGTQPLPLEEYLGKFAITVNHQETSKPWGMSLSAGDQLTITHIHRQSAASQAGLAYNDTIIAIDGLKATNQLLTLLNKQQSITKQPVQIHAFRRDELMTFELPPDNTYHQTVSLSGDGGQWLSFCFDK